MPITDRESANAWREDKPHEVQVAFAVRCALRALPGIATADRAKVGDIALPVMRAILISGVAAVGPTPEVSEAASSAAARSTFSNAAAATSAASAARSAASAASAASRSAAFSAAWSAADADATRLDTDTPEFLFRRPLWPSSTGVALSAEGRVMTDSSGRVVLAQTRGRMPDGLSDALTELRRYWNEGPDTWGFWARWYQKMLENGAPMDWDLQREVALIPDADWKEGPEHIAQKIAEIEARYALKSRIRDLEWELARASGNRLGIGGNNPPEPIDGAPEIARELVVVWEPLQELKAEVDADIPDKDRIRKLLGSLALGLRKGLEWCAAKADLAVDTAIKWAIPAAGGGYLAMNPEKLQAVIEAARAWLNTLP